MKRLTLSLTLIIGLTIISTGWKSASDDNVEAFSISLSVTDIQASKTFYEHLGFQALAGQGSIKDKWLIMKNGNAKIGLFQGFFPKNTITMNPKDVRSIYKMATDAGLKPAHKIGMDKTEGPASFSVVDPDGNPVLIDQH